MLLDAKFDGGEVTDSRLGFDIDERAPASTGRHPGIRLPRAPKIDGRLLAGATVPHVDRLVRLGGLGPDPQQVLHDHVQRRGPGPAGNISPVLSDVQPAYTRLDAGAGYTRPDGKMRLEAVGTNLTNTTYMTSLINTPGLNLRWFNPPRQIGVRLSLYW